MKFYYRMLKITIADKKMENYILYSLSRLYVKSMFFILFISSVFLYLEISPLRELIAILNEFSFHLFCFEISQYMIAIEENIYLLFNSLKINATLYSKNFHQNFLVKVEKYSELTMKWNC